jgi:Uma2 family endonuclease
MSTIVAPQLVDPPLPLYELSVAQYHDMIRTGIIRSGDPIELIEGTLVKKMPVTNPHIFVVGYLQDYFIRLLPVGWFVNIRSPITTTDSEPEPDIAVIRGDRRQFLVQNRHPGPSDTEFLIEVSDSSLAFDRTTKLRVYARANIQQYWIVDVIGRKVAVHSGPTGPGNAPAYQHTQEFVPGQDIPVMLDGLEVGRVKVAELFL